MNSLFPIESNSNKSSYSILNDNKISDKNVLDELDLITGIIGSKASSKVEQYAIDLEESINVNEPTIGHDFRSYCKEKELNFKEFAQLLKDKKIVVLPVELQEGEEEKPKLVCNVADEIAQNFGKNGLELRRLNKEGKIVSTF